MPCNPLRWKVISFGACLLRTVDRRGRTNNSTLTDVKHIKKSKVKWANMARNGLGGSGNTREKNEATTQIGARGQSCKQSIYKIRACLTLFSSPPLFIDTQSRQTLDSRSTVLRVKQKYNTLTVVNTRSPKMLLSILDHPRTPRALNLSEPPLVALVA